MSRLWRVVSCASESQPTKTMKESLCFSTGSVTSVSFDNHSFWRTVWSQKLAYHNFIRRPWNTTLKVENPVLLTTTRAFLLQYRHNIIHNFINRNFSQNFQLIAHLEKYFASITSKCSQTKDIFIFKEILHLHPCSYKQRLSSSWDSARTT